MKFFAPLALLAVAEGAQLEAEWTGYNRGGYGLGRSYGRSYGMGRSYGSGYGMGRNLGVTSYGRSYGGYGGRSYGGYGAW